MIDLMTVVPIYVMFGDTCPSLKSTNTTEEIIQFILCGLQNTRILRALRLRRRFSMIEDEVNQFLANMILNIVVMILFSKWQLMYLDVGYRSAFNHDITCLS